MRYEFFKNGQKNEICTSKAPNRLKSRRKTHLVAIVVRCYVFKLTDYFKYRYRDVFWLNLDLIALKWKQKRCFVIKNAIKFIHGVPERRFHESGCQKDGQEHEITLQMGTFLAHIKAQNEPTITFLVVRVASKRNFGSNFGHIVDKKYNKIWCWKRALKKYGKSWIFDDKSM